jgi:hypothetical protein
MLNSTIQSINQTAEIVELNFGGFGILEPLNQLKISFFVQDLS